ncbi:MAG: CYTH domain-containing protein [Magnetococcales bacterium]|nr:CYTH domain-containing protein [Magnetococcales bacterium]
MPQELEIKLTAPNQKILTALLSDPEVRHASGGQLPQDHSYSAHYADTKTRQLLKQRFAFRSCRRTPHEVRVGLKGGGSVVEGVGAWEEVEQTLPAPVNRPDQLPDGALKRRLCSMISADAALLPLLATHIKRQTLVLTLHDDTQAEMALDFGYVEAGGKTQRICELELELLTGDFEVIRAFALVLKDRYELQFARGSKFSAGLALLGMSGEFDKP